MDEAFKQLARRRVMPWIHGLRMLGQAGQRWPLTSADSTNVARNHKRQGSAEAMARAIDSVQPLAHLAHKQRRPGDWHPGLLPNH